jgi:Icc-related predicted phosphoesterase
VGVQSLSLPESVQPPRRLRVAAAGDVHCDEDSGPRVAVAIKNLQGTADIVLLAGDLTTHGEPAQATALAAACATLGVPVLAVLGNHDWHANRAAELVDVLEQGGVHVLDRACAVHEIEGVKVGVVGVKGFVGGFAGSHLPDFGEPLLREVYAETTRDVDALAAGLTEIALCHVRIVLMHYSPAQATLEGEPIAIWPFLGCDRLAAPIAEHEPDMVLHGHAHAGSFQGAIGPTPVYNVAVPVTGRDFWLFELDVPAPTALPIR